MRSATLGVAAALVLVTGACSDGSSNASSPSEPVVSDAFLGETDAGRSAALYLTIEQNGGDDRLIGVSTDVSEIVGMMPATVEMEDAFTDRSVDAEVDAGSTVRFAPGDDHLMVINVTRALEVGDDVRVTLTFERHDPVVVAASTLSLLDINERAADALEEADS